MPAAQERYFELLLDKVRDDRYPSGELMDRIEAAISSREQVEEYLDILFQKTEAGKYPSKQMLDRIARVTRAAGVAAAAG